MEKGQEGTEIKRQQTGPGKGRWGPYLILVIILVVVVAIVSSSLLFPPRTWGSISARAPKTLISKPALLASSIGVEMSTTVKEVTRSEVHMGQYRVWRAGHGGGEERERARGGTGQTREGRRRPVDSFKGKTRGKRQGRAAEREGRGKGRGDGRRGAW